MRTTTSDGHRGRARRPFGPTTDVLLDVFCLFLNAGNPESHPLVVDVEMAPVHK